MSALEIAKELIACESITPHAAKAFDALEAHLKEMGFEIWRETFTEPGYEDTENLYARLGKASPNLCFAGHLDVVPPGDWSRWTYPPFEPTIVDGVLYGRGAEDMKSAIAAFVTAVKQLLAEGTPNGSISFLITGDEEGVAVNGTKKMLDWLKDKGEQIDACIVGEPTNPSVLGEMIKVGRRGSINAVITVLGKQGHVAYPHLAQNPVTKLVDCMHELQRHALDEGTEFFPPSNLEVTTMDVGNETCNLIPATAQGRLNIRFNDLHTGESLQQWIADVCNRVIGAGLYELDCRISGDAFLTQDDKLTQALVGAVEEITGMTPKLSTTGGTSDARFIKDVCPVIEFGTTGETAHHVDECVKVETVEKLAEVYLRFLKSYLIA